MRYKTVYVGYGLSLIALLILRVCQLAFTVEPQTGFYKHQYSGFWCISLAVIAVFVAALIYFSFTDSDVKINAPIGKSCAALSPFVAVGIIIRIIPVLQNFAGVMSALLVSSAAAAAAAYIIKAYQTFTGKKVQEYISVLTAPFWLISLVYLFLENNDISSVPERYYGIVTASLCVLCSLSQLKNDVKMLSKISAKTDIAISLITSVFCIIYTLPHYILMLFGKGYLLHGNSLADIVYLFFGIYAAIYAFSKPRPEK